MKDHMDKFCELFNEADFVNKKYAPFITSEIYSSYADLEKGVKHIFREYVHWYNYKTPYVLNGETITKEILAKRITQEQKELSVLSDKILNQIRTYLRSLDVLEEKD